MLPPRLNDTMVCSSVPLCHGAMTTRQAAEILQVTTEAVRKMLKTGRLEQTGVVGRMLLIDVDSVHRIHREGKRAGRLWTEQTAWAALFLLSCQKVT